MCPLRALLGVCVEEGERFALEGFLPLECFDCIPWCIELVLLSPAFPPNWQLPADVLTRGRRSWGPASGSSWGEAVVAFQVGGTQDSPHRAQGI